MSNLKTFVICGLLSAFSLVAEGSLRERYWEESAVGPVSGKRVTVNKWIVSLVIQSDPAASAKEHASVVETGSLWNPINLAKHVGRSVKRAVDHVAASARRCAGHSFVVVEGLETEGDHKGKAWVYAAHATTSGGEWHISTYGTKRGLQYGTGKESLTFDTRQLLFGSDGRLSAEGKRKFVSPSLVDDKTEEVVKFATIRQVNSENGRRITDFLRAQNKFSQEHPKEFSAGFDVLNRDGKPNCIGFASSAFAAGGITFSPKTMMGIAAPGLNVDETFTRLSSEVVLK